MPDHSHSCRWLVADMSSHNKQMFLRRADLVRVVRMLLFGMSCTKHTLEHTKHVHCCCSICPISEHMFLKHPGLYRPSTLVDCLTCGGAGCHLQHIAVHLVPLLCCQSEQVGNVAYGMMVL